MTTTVDPVTGSPGPGKPRQVALFATCLVETYRPAVGFAALKLLRQTGITVVIPPHQTCCGQPAYNSGDRRGAKRLAKRVIAECESYEAVIIPSGSCAGMIRQHYPELLADEPAWADRAKTLAAKTYELTEFLYAIGAADQITAHCDARVTYHDSCSSRRELGIVAQPRALLQRVDGLDLHEIENGEECCGFGGTFCTKHPDISGHMAQEKAEAAIASGADILLAADLGCLLNIAGRLRRLGSEMTVRHVAEILADDHDTPGIAADTSGRGPSR